MIKRLVLLVVVLVVLVAVGGFAATFYINDLVKIGVEKGGSLALGTKTTLGSADVGLMSGKAAINTLAVTNPQGFKAPEFMSLGSGAVEVSLSSLRADVVEIPKIELSTIRVVLERKDGKTNYKVILDNLAKLQSGSGGGATPKPSAEGSGKKFIVKDLKITDVKVTVDMLDTPVPIGSLVVPIDQIHLTDIGTASKGLPMADIVGIVVRAVLSTASANGKGIIPSDILGDLQGQLGALGNLDQLGVNVQAKVGAELEKAADKARAELEKGLGEASKKVEDGIKKGVDDAVKDIFGGGKKK
jgi:hypothetical protein